MATPTEGTPASALPRVATTTVVVGSGAIAVVQRTVPVTASGLAFSTVSRGDRVCSAPRTLATAASRVSVAP